MTWDVKGNAEKTDSQGEKGLSVQTEIARVVMQHYQFELSIVWRDGFVR